MVPHVSSRRVLRRRAVVAATVMLAALLPAALPAAADPPPPPAGGSLDTSFGDGGVQLLPRGAGVIGTHVGAPVVSEGDGSSTVVITDPFPLGEGGGTGAGLIARRGPDGAALPYSNEPTGIRSLQQGAAAFVASGGPDSVVSDGAYVYVGGYLDDGIGGSLAVQRYDADGLQDLTYGGNGTAITGFAGRAGSMAVDALGNLLVALDGDGGWQVVRFLPDGSRDTAGWASQNENGKADVPVPGTAGSRIARLLVSYQDVYVGGTSYGLDEAQEETTSIAVAKLTSTGQLATQAYAGFGAFTFAEGTSPTGQVGYVVMGLDGLPVTTSGPELAVGGLRRSDDGQLLVAGTERGSTSSTGYVLKLSYEGRDVPNPLDLDFGSGGVTRVSYEGGSSTVAALTQDQFGRLLLAGGGVRSTGGLPVPALARVRSDGSVDTDFGNAGSELMPCTSDGALTSSQVAGGRLLVGGLCGADPVLYRLRQDGTLSNLTTGFRLDCGDGCSEPVIGDVVLEAGPQTTYTGDLSRDALEAAVAELQASPLRYSPLRYSPLRYSPLRYSPLRYSPLRYSPVDDEQVRGLTPVTLNQVPLVVQPPPAPQEWAEVLADTPLEGRPLQTVLVSDVLGLLDADPLEISGNKAAQITALDLGRIDLSQTSLRNTSLGAFLLGGTPLPELTPPADGWCGYAAAHGAASDSGCDDPDATPLSLELAGVDLTDWFGEGHTLVGLDLVDAPLLEIRLADLDLYRTPLVGRLLASSLSQPSLFCSLECEETELYRVQWNGHLVPEATIGDLIDPAKGIPTVPTDSTASLGDVLLGMFENSTVPFEGLTLDALLAGGFNSPSRYESSVLIDCSTVTDLVMTMPVPPGTTIQDSGMQLDGTAAGAEPLASTDDLVLLPPAAPGQPSTVRGTLSAPLGCAGTAQATLYADMRRPRVLSSTIGAATASGGGVDLVSPPRRFTVVDPLPTPAQDSSDDTVSGQTLTLGFLSEPEARDSYYLSVAPGDEVTLTLSHLPADYDLLVYDHGRETPPGGPQGIPNTPLRYSPLRYSPLRYSPTDDAGPPGGASTGDPATGPEQPQGVPSADGRLKALSVNRGQEVESIQIPIRDDGTSLLRIDVVPFNGATSDDPYLLHTEVEPAVELPDCLGAPVFLADDPGVLHDTPASVPPDTQSLILVNARRMTRLYGAEAATALWTKLEQFAASPLVEGALLDVGTDPGVAAAVAALDDAPCSVPRSNDVVTAVNRLVDTVRPGADGLRFVTLVGGDTALPMGRVPDLTEIANQSDYAPATRIGKKDNAVSRAFGTQYLLSDDPYAALAPSPFLDTQLFLPDLAVGRLVETPVEIIASVQEFLDDEGIRDVQGSFTAAYDFLIDLGDELESLKPTVPGDDTDQEPLNNGTWTREQAEDALAANSRGFSSLNGHYDNNRALPADQDSAGTQEDLLSAQTSLPADLADGILATVGCNAGVNLEDLLLRPRPGDPTFAPDEKDEARTRDWAQRISAARGLFVANTGFGYGDDAAIAYSEKVIAGFAGRLDGSMTVGQALQFAKQGYLDSATFGVYDHKAVQEATLFGLPQWRVGPSGQVATTVLPDADVPAALDLVLVPRSLAPSANLRTTGRGEFYDTGNDNPQVTAYRPVQPKSTVAMEPDADGRLVHGVLLDGLTTRETPIDPLVSVPLVDSRDKQPEPDADGVYFPTTLQQVLSRTTPNGLEDLLVLVTGQFRDGPTGGVQRLVTAASTQVTYSGSTDFDPPTVELVTGSIVDDALLLDVTAPSSDTSRVLALYLSSAGGSTPRPWSLLELESIGGGQWRATAPLPAGTTTIGEFYVQAMDSAGNVTVNSNKGVNYTAQEVDEPGPSTGPVDPGPGPLPAASPSSSTLPSPSPTASSPSPAAPSPSPSSSPSPGPDVTLSATTLTARQPVVVSGVAPPGRWLTIHAYSRPSTTYREVRQFEVPADGRFSVPLFPQSNTRLYAAVDGSPGRSVVVLVRPLVNLTATAVGRLQVDFSGRILPHQRGVLMTIYRRAEGGRDVITAQTSTDSTGRFALRRRFIAPGTWAFLARSGSGLVSVSGTSPVRVVNIR